VIQSFKGYLGKSHYALHRFFMTVCYIQKKNKRLLSHREMRLLFFGSIINVGVG